MIFPHSLILTTFWSIYACLVDGSKWYNWPLVNKTMNGSIDWCSIGIPSDSWLTKPIVIYSAFRSMGWLKEAIFEQQWLNCTIQLVLEFSPILHLFFHFKIYGLISNKIYLRLFYCENMKPSINRFDYRQAT